MSIASPAGSPIGSHGGNDPVMAARSAVPTHVAPVTGGRRYEFWSSGKDEMRWASLAAVGGLAAAVVLALIGGFPVDMPMPTHRVGLVNPTCGLTRGSTAFARGDLGLAWRYNPATFLVMGFGVLGLGRWLVGLVTGRWLNMRLRPGRIGWWAVGLGLFVLWAYQQWHAEFVINARF